MSIVLSKVIYFNYLNEIKIRLVFWKGRGKYKEGKGEECICFLCFDFIGKKYYENKRKEFGLFIVFK